MDIWQELGMSAGTASIVLIVLYFIIKWAVRNGIKEAYRDITGKKTVDKLQTDEMIKELDLEEE